VTSTRGKLIDGVIAILREQGIAGISARAIAAAAGVSQGLIFYHFGSVGQLVAAACREATEARVALYRARFADVGTFRELAALGRELHEQERQAGNVTVLAHVLAGAQRDQELAEAARDALRLWVSELQAVLSRLLADSPFADFTDAAGLAQATAAAFIGIELYEAADPASAAAALDALEILAALATIADEAGPVARRALRAWFRRER
jgi:AcrR family transcriptional regulator